MKIDPKYTALGLFVTLTLAWSFIIILGQLAIIPCLAFVTDTSQGYYTSTCALIDDNHYFLLGGNHGAYDAIPGAWTWIALPFIFLTPPLTITIFAGRFLSRQRSARLKARP